MKSLALDRLLTGKSPFQNAPGAGNKNAAQASGGD
jgi:hypothetical protein